MTDMDPQDDPLPDPEDLVAIAELTEADINRIDQSILDSCSPQWRKVAYVVSLAMDAYPDLYQGIPDVFYSQRVGWLVSTGKLEAQGNLRRMRFSEIRLAATDFNDDA